MLGFIVRPRTILLEGTTDADLFALAAREERRRTGVDLFGNEFAMAAAGAGDEGGTTGVIRELTRLKGYARITLLPNGRPKYRFIGLFDNDAAGRYAVRTANIFDTSIVEYRDVFRLRPKMPETSNLDPSALGRAFDKQNEPHQKLDWEVEDLFGTAFLQAFIKAEAIMPRKTFEIAGQIHREWSADGKARLHRFIRENAIHDDLSQVIEVIRILRTYLGLSALR